MPNGRHNISCGYCSNGDGPRKDVTCNRFSKQVPYLGDDSCNVLCSEFDPNEAYLSNISNYPDQRLRLLETIEEQKAQLPFGKLCKYSNYDGISIVMDLSQFYVSNCTDLQYPPNVQLEWRADPVLGFASAKPALPQPPLNIVLGGQKVALPNSAVAYLEQWHAAHTSSLDYFCVDHRFEASDNGSAFIDCETKNHITRIVIWNHNFALEVIHIESRSGDATIRFDGPNLDTTEIGQKLAITLHWLESQRGRH